MSPEFWRALWSLVFMVLMLGGAYAIAAHTFLMQVHAANNPVAIYDDYAKNTHHLKGTVTVPRTCDELMASTESLSANMVRVVFITWEEPAVPCTRAPTPRDFAVTAFGASSTRFVATLDGASVVVAVHPTVVWVNASTSIKMKQSTDE